jgi:hypothetical protein
MTFLRLVWILDKTHRKRGKVMLQFQLRINWFRTCEFNEIVTEIVNRMTWYTFDEQR